MPQFYKPGLDDSVINVSDDEVSKYLGGNQTLENSGYVPYTGQNNQGGGGAGADSGAAGGAGTSADGLGGFVPFTESAAGQADYKTLQDLNSHLGILTTEEEQSIKQQTQAKGLEYDVLIADAKEKKRQGLATATVRTGQNGGFESTQGAGAAALAPIVGGDFVGQGGSLEKVKSTYDLNISNLEVQKQQAIVAAESALREAKLTGKKDAYDRAKGLFELAEKSHNDALNLAFKKIEAMKTVAETNKLNKDTADAFFKGSDIVGLMKSVPAGQSFELQDPATGTVYTIQGVSQANPNVIQVADDKGVVRGIDKSTGQVLWKTDPGVGKSKTGPSNLSITYPRQDRTYIYDTKGKQVGYQTYNPISGGVTNYSLTGQSMEFPAGGKLGSQGEAFNEQDSSNPFNVDFGELDLDGN